MTDLADRRGRMKTAELAALGERLARMEAALRNQLKYSAPPDCECSYCVEARAVLTDAPSDSVVVPGVSDVARQDRLHGPGMPWKIWLIDDVNSVLEILDDQGRKVLHDLIFFRLDMLDALLQRVEELEAR